MTKEQFIALGLTEEQAARAAEASKAELIGYIPKARFDEVNNAKKQAEETVKERDKQIRDLSDKAKENEELTEQIRDLQAAHKTAVDKYAADLRELKMKTALKLFLSAGTHDPDLVAGLLDTSKIELDDSGNVRAGLEDQVKALKKSKAFLFKERNAQLAFTGIKPVEGKGKGGDSISTGAGFAQPTNSSGRVPAAVYNLWSDSEKEGMAHALCNDIPQSRGYSFPRKLQGCELYRRNFRRRRDGKRPGPEDGPGRYCLRGQQAERAFRKAFEGVMLWVK